MRINSLKTISYKLFFMLETTHNFPQAYPQVVPALFAALLSVQGEQGQDFLIMGV
jgi:hypothetical protein